MITEQSLWSKLRQQKAAWISLWFILVLIVMAILGYAIMPDSSPSANRIILPISTQEPGSKFLFLKVPVSATPSESSFFTKMWMGEKEKFKYVPLAAYRFAGDTLWAKEYSGAGSEENAEQAYSLAMLMGLDGMNRFSASTELQKKVEQERIEEQRFYLGTDRYGRDMLSRLILGARISLSVGFMAVLISVLVGTVLGAMAGYFGGWLDALISWLINVIWSLPTLLLVIAISFALGKGFWQVFVAVGLSMWVEVARLVRGQMLSLREKEYIEATRVMGFSNRRIIIRHLLPNCLGPLLVVASANFASAILLEAGLSFLGFGAQPPFPSWGSMIKEHYGYIVIDAAYMAILPGLAIMLVVYAFNLLSIGLRDALDVKAETTTI